MMSVAWIALLVPSLLVAQDTEEDLKKKQAEIVAYLKTAKTEREFRAVVMDYTRLGLKAEDLFRYELAAKLYADAEKVIRTALKDTSLAQSLAESAKKAGDVGKEYARAVKSFDRVMLKEGTPEDHLAVGKFLCFVKGAWDVGIPDLAKGSDAALKKLAEADAAGGDTPEAQVGLGDSWMAASKKEPAAKERAVHWFRQAWPKLRGIDREKTRTKVKSILFRPPTKEGPVPAGWTKGANAGTSRCFIDESVSRGGRRSLCFLSSETPTPWWIQAWKGVPPGKYTLSAWVMSDGTEKEVPIFQYKLRDKEDKQTVWINVNVPADQPFWSRFEQTFEVPAGFKLQQILAWEDFTAGRLWIDDISIKSEGGVEFFENGGFEK